MVSIQLFQFIYQYLYSGMFYRTMEFNNKSTFVVQEIIITGLDGVPYPKLVGAAILFVLLFILFGSFTNIAIIVFNRPLHSPMYFLICTLAMVDIIYTSSMSTTMLNVLLGEERRVQFSLCILQHFLFHLGTAMEPLTITLMAFDRLIAISSPLRYHTILSNRNIFVLIVGIWSIGIICSGLWTSMVNNLPFCKSNTTPYSFCDFSGLVRTACVDPRTYFNIASTMLNCLLWMNFCLIIVSYMRIVYAVLKMPSTIDRKKTFNTCISHIIVVACFFFSKMVLSMSQLSNIGFSLTFSNRNALTICSTLGPSLVNPYVYGLQTKEIRKRLTDLFNPPVMLRLNWTDLNVFSLKNKY